MTGEQRRAHYGEYADWVGPGAMTDEMKEWDREMVASIPAILAEAGFTVLRSDGGGG